MQVNFILAEVHSRSRGVMGDTHTPRKCSSPTLPPSLMRQGTQEGLSADVLKGENSTANVSRGRCLWENAS